LGGLKEGRWGKEDGWHKKERDSECVWACRSGRISKTVEGGMKEDKTYTHSLPTHKPSRGRRIITPSRRDNCAHA